MRLIDADELNKVKFHELPYTHIVPADLPKPQTEAYERGWNDAIDAIMKSADTTDAVPRWIPCEERLPEPNVAVLGYAPEFNNIFAVYYDSICGWMTWSPAGDEPFPSCQGEIVAWMPMPEPWKEEDDEKAQRR